MIRVFILLLLGIAPAVAQHVEKGGIIHSTSTVPSTVVASLPACNGSSNGSIYLVTNALTPTVGATVAGGGAVTVLVHCNGSNWVVA
jgi:hypothetical protein